MYRKATPALMIAALILASLFSLSAHSSIPQCTSGESDPDGDGWGWENNQSCIVNDGTTVLPEVSRHPTCLSPDSDPDGDGWGWENNKSCLVHEPDPIDFLPGGSIETATEIPLDTVISNVMPAAANEEHWYSFSITNDRPVAVRFPGSASPYSLNFFVQFTGGAKVREIYFDYEDSGEIVCIPPDSYLIRISGDAYVGEDVSYQFAIEESTFRCEFPDNAESSSGVFAPIPGGYALFSDRTLTAYSHEGNQRWQYELVDYSAPFHTIIQHRNDVIYVFVDEFLYSIDLDGNLNWRYDFGSWLYYKADFMAIDDESIYWSANSQLFVFNLDGTQRWVAKTRGRVKNVEVADNGSLYVVSEEGYSVFSIH